MGGLRDWLLPPKQIGSIAVLPLDNLSGDADQDYLAEGMTDELITQLTKIEALKVIAATSVQGFRSTQTPVADIARRLRVRSVVLGSVVGSADRVRVNVRLVEASGGQQLWAESYERGLRDVLGLQSEVALAIAHGIKARLTPGEKLRLVRSTVVDPEAYRDCLRGRYFLKRFTEQDFERAQHYFERAIARDPAYAPAYAGIADRYYEASSVWMPALAAIPKARQAALQALAIDSTLAEAHCSLAMIQSVFEVNRSAAERGFRRAISLNPGYALAHSRFGYVLSINSRHDEAIRELTQAVDIDPLSPFTASTLGLAYYFARRYPDAIRHLEDTIALDTSFYLPHIFLGMSLVAAGRTNDGIRQLETGTRLDNNLQGEAERGWAYARGGRRDDALAVVDLIHRRVKDSLEVSPDFDLACIYAELGDRDAAFRSLDRALAEASEALLWINVDPRADALRGDSRFADVLRRLGYPVAGHGIAIAVPRDGIRASATAHSELCPNGDRRGRGGTITREPRAYTPLPRRLHPDLAPAPRLTLAPAPPASASARSVRRLHPPTTDLAFGGFLPASPPAATTTAAGASRTPRNDRP